MKTTSQLEIVGCFRNLFSLPTKSLLTEQISENKISFGVFCENPSFSNNFPLCQELGLSSQFMYVPAANLAMSMVCTSSDLNLSASGYFSMVTLRTYLLCLHMYIYTFFLVETSTSTAGQWKRKRVLRADILCMFLALYWFSYHILTGKLPKTLR
jgi:hypothetical protein